MPPRGATRNGWVGASEGNESPVERGPYRLSKRQSDGAKDARALPFMRRLKWRAELALSTQEM
jgi:hypothetical protein